MIPANRPNTIPILEKPSNRKPSQLKMGDSNCPATVFEVFVREADTGPPRFFDGERGEAWTLGGVEEEGAGDGDALLLAPGQADPALPDLGGV